MHGLAWVTLAMACTMCQAPLELVLCSGEIKTEGGSSAGEISHREEERKIIKERKERKKGRKGRRRKQKQREPVQDFLVHGCCGVQQLFDLHSNR